MEEQATLSGRIVQLEFEPRRDAAARLADAYRRLVPPPQEIDPGIHSVQQAGHSSAKVLVMEAVS